MVYAKKYIVSSKTLARDIRPWTVKLAEALRDPGMACTIIGLPAAASVFVPALSGFSDFFLLGTYLYYRWFSKRKFSLPLKMPSFARGKDPNNPPPGKKGAGNPEGIMFLGNDQLTGQELWITNNDARTHILYLGTTGAGKTEGLKGIVTNALTWGSGFVYIDGKADTDLWGALFSLARRFGRDDDLLVLNYMRGNSDAASSSNSMNPFSSGSSSYLTNLLVNLMDDSGDDNAMWKGRAIALLSSLMPALTWKRDNQGLLLDVGTVRDYLTMPAIIRLSRDPALPDRIVRGVQSYLDTLPGYVDEAFDDEGNEIPLPPDRPPIDLSIPRQQHGYLAMQFTRALQSLADEYGYIFKVQLADINLMDVVLNRRIMVVLIPALEKSADEAANLGKIVAASLKGMMGSTLGAQVEGDWGGIIENKVTRSNSPFVTVFDEVGYYTAQGMAVMAAQARSLGFSLVFAAQDLPAMEKRVKEEARSITGNCNVKIFGKLEDPTDTKDYFEKTAGDMAVSETQGFTGSVGAFNNSYDAKLDPQITKRSKAAYDHLKEQKEGEAHVLFGTDVISTKMFYCVPGKAKALRVQRLLPVAPPISNVTTRDRAINEVARRLRDPEWSAMTMAAPLPTAAEIEALTFGFSSGQAAQKKPLECAAMAIANVASLLAQMPEETGEPDVGMFDPFSAMVGGGADVSSFWDTTATPATDDDDGMMGMQADEQPSMQEASAALAAQLEATADSMGGFENMEAPAMAVPDGQASPDSEGLFSISPSIDAILRKTAATVQSNLFAEGENLQDDAEK